VTSSPLDCWKCGAPLVDLPLPVGRSEYCRACRAEIHVCRMCRFYDLSKAKQCAEPVAADSARTALDALFSPKK
jgi:hypothetical protein